MKYILRPRQEQAVNKIDNFIVNSTKNHGIFVYPTSFGKSLVISAIASKYPDKYFINVTTSKELLKQNYEKYTSYGFTADICSASLGSKEVGRVTFATITTIAKFVDFYKDKDVVILQDECHEHSVIDSQIDKFIKKIKKYKLVGLTATPFRLSQTMDGTSLKMMNRDRKCIYKSIEDIVQINEVVEQNYWSNLIYDIRDVDEKKLVLATTGVSYTDESLQKFKEDNDLISKITKEVKSLIDSGRKSILISVPFISDAQEIASKIGCCEAVFSGMDAKERDRIINGFKALEIPVVIQCKILSLGFDHPQLDAIIMARPSNSLTFVYQLVGRGVRKHKNKKDCVVVDFSGNIKKFGHIETLIIENDPLTKGWAVFNNDTLLTNYPLNTTNRPTKLSLKANLDWSMSPKKSNGFDLVMTFGKYKNKKISTIIKENKSYLTWLLDQKDFKWHGESGTNLKNCIERHLGIFVEKVPQSRIVSKNSLVAHTEKYNFKNISEVF